MYAIDMSLGVLDFVLLLLVPVILPGASSSLLAFLFLMRLRAVIVEDKK